MSGNLGSLDDEVAEPGTGNGLIFCLASLTIGSYKQAPVRIKPVLQERDSPVPFGFRQAFHQGKIDPGTDLGLYLVDILATRSGRPGIFTLRQAGN